jgi:hypothetical protein
MNACIEEEVAVLESAKDKERRNQNALDSAGAMCLAFNSEY